MPCIAERMQPLAIMAMNNRSSIQSTAGKHKDLCDLQSDLTKLAAKKCTTENFEGEWKLRKPADRKRHYMEAMSTVCNIPEMESQRK